MIVCHCNVLLKKQIIAAVEELIAEDRYRVITPGLVFRVLEKRGKCCGCFPTIIALITETIDNHRLETEKSDEQVVKKVITPHNSLEAVETEDTATPETTTTDWSDVKETISNERQRKSYRTTQCRASSRTRSRQSILAALPSS